MHAYLLLFFVRVEAAMAAASPSTLDLKFSFDGNSLCRYTNIIIFESVY